jgi:glycine cleavage system aminomethyltransferase T
MAYLEPRVATIGSSLLVDVRGKFVEVEVAKMPFVAQRYFRG